MALGNLNCSLCCQSPRIAARHHPRKTESRAEVSDDHSCGPHACLPQPREHFTGLHKGHRSPGLWQDSAEQLSVHSGYWLLGWKSMKATSVSESEPLTGKDRPPWGRESVEKHPHTSPSCFRVQGGKDYIQLEQDKVLAGHMCKHRTDLSGREANGSRRVKTELMHREENTKRQVPYSNCPEPRKLMRI